MSGQDAEGVRIRDALDVASAEIELASHDGSNAGADAGDDHNMQHESLQYDDMNAVPTSLMYRNESVGVRPSLHQLLSGEGLNFDKTQDLRERQRERQEKEGQKKLFSMFEGVFARALLAMFGVLMFLRLAWIVGLAGVWYAS